MLKNPKLLLLICLLLTILILRFHDKTPATLDDSQALSTNEIQESIAEKILRFHIIANSDSDEDQALKINVRDAVLEYTKPFLNDLNTNDSDSLSSAINILDSHLSDIEAVARNTIQKNGYDYAVTAQICQCYFPVKSYCDLVLPAGDYTSLNITIGNGDGHNWWCVMYPSLCFIDHSIAILPESSKDDLSNILSKEEYDCVIVDEDEDLVSFSYSFKLWDWIKKELLGK